MANENITLQLKELQVCSTANGSEDTTLIGSGTNLTKTYRAASLVDNQLKLQNFTNGIFSHVRGTTTGDTGAFERWGYPVDGDAEFLGEYSYTIGTMKADDGSFYADEFVLVTEAQHKVKIRNMSGGKAVLKGDNIGFRHLVALMTTVSAGTAKVFMRPW